MSLRKLVIATLIFAFGSLGPLEAVASDVRTNSALMVSSWDSQSRVWRVFADGKVTLVLDLKSIEKGGDGLYSGGAAIASRNQQRVAYIWRNDIWAIDTHSGGKVRITSVGRPMTDTDASIEAHPLLWSWEGGRILYRVLPGDAEDPEGRRPPWKVRKARYGTYLFDFSTKSAIEVPGFDSFPLQWLPDDTVLAWSGNRLYQRGVRSDKASQIRRLDDIGMQASAAPDGRSMLVNRSDLSSWSQIARIDLTVEPWQVLPISPKGRFAEFQWPRLSPSGKRYAYAHRVGMGSVASFELRVEDRNIYSYGNATYTWINDDVIAIQERESARTTSIVVVDVNSGRRIATHEFSKE